MPAATASRKTKKPRRAMKKGTATERLGMRAVGPAFSTPQDAESVGWDNVRQKIVGLAKRYSLQSEEARLELSRPKTKKSRSKKKSRRRKVRKGHGAPSAHSEDDDLEGITQTDFVDDTMVPPFDLEALCLLYENSGALRRNIDAMVTNIDGFGHRFEPVLEFTAPDILDSIRDLLLREKLESVEDLMTVTTESLEEAMPGFEEVAAKKTLWQMLASIEHGRLNSFFGFINPLETFTKLRKATRQELELLGNAAWEVLRKDTNDVTSKITDTYHVPFRNVRLIRADANPTMVKVKVRKDAIHYDTVEVPRHFRRYVRIVGSTRTYYKEFGDPRVVSRFSGRRYESVDKLKEEEGDAAVQASELFHWQIRSPMSAYGVPRWIGELISVLGSRSAEEVNLLYFDNKAIPPMVLMVSGGRVSESSIDRIASHIEERIKGRENFHKILILEGLPADADESSGDIEHSGKMRMELKPLMKELPQDALFQTYDANNQVKIGRSFRQPQILTGDTRDMNRSTAEVAKALAEEQVYQPERDDFDAVMNRHFLPSLNAHFWVFRTNAPIQRFPDSLIENVRKSLESGAITPNEARRLIADAFSIDLSFRDEDWAKSPPKVVLAAMRQGGMAGPDSLEGAAEIESDGEALARGKTSESEGHDHQFTAVVEGDAIRIEVASGSEDGHTHAAELVPYVSGEEVSIKTGDHEGHTHTVSFTPSELGKRRRKTKSSGADQAAIALFALRRSIQQELDYEMDLAKDAWLESAKAEWQASGE